MQIVKNTGKDKSKYPYYVALDSGRNISIPQQKKFGSYCQKHGCSVTAVSIASMCCGIRQTDGTFCNPKEVYKWAKKHIKGYNGSKLSIWGCYQTLKKMGVNAEWWPNDGKRNALIINHITQALQAGCVVLFEEKNPIHTVVFLGINPDGTTNRISNGKVKKAWVSHEVTKKALHGSADWKKQKGWYKSKCGAGYVVVKGVQA